MKILSCNIRVNLQEDQDAGNGWDDRKDLCLDVMRSRSADIICVQECRSVHLADLKRGLPQFDTFGLSNPGEGYHPFNAIFFLKDRFVPISSGGFWLSETPHVAGSQSWDSARPRFANWVDLTDRETGRDFRMWNTHLDHIGAVARVKQAEVIVQGSEVLGDLPQLLTGDFNTDASDPAIATLKSGGWTDTYETVHGPVDPGFTYHGFLGPEFLVHKPNARIKGKMDFIFARGPVKPIAAEVIRDGRDGRFPSDHYFISTEVEL